MIHFFGWRLDSDTGVSQFVHGFMNIIHHQCQVPKSLTLFIRIFLIPVIRQLKTGLGILIKT